jgi:hypothetical protein
VRERSKHKEAGTGELRVWTQWMYLRDSVGGSHSTSVSGE